jgi:hypothetical protein
MVSYSRPRSLPWASPPPLPTEMATMTGNAVLGDEIVEDGEEAAVDAVRADDEGRCGARDVLFGDVDGNVTGVGCGVAGGNQHPGGIGGVGGAEGVGVASDAGVEVAIGGAHGELDDSALGDGGVGGQLRRGVVGGADDEVAVGGGGRDCAVGEIPGGDEAGSVGVADGRGRARRTRQCGRGEGLRRHGVGELGGCGGRCGCQGDQERDAEGTEHGGLLVVGGTGEMARAKKIASYDER